MKRQLKEGDWIALRLLALLLKTDVSNQTIPDVRKTMDYYQHELGVPLLSVLWELIKETADEVENPESAMLSRFESTLNVTYEKLKRPWINLTEQEIGELYKAGWANNMDFARAIEAKVKEKNR